MNTDIVPYTMSSSPANTPKLKRSREYSLDPLEFSSDSEETKFSPEQKRDATPPHKPPYPLIRQDAKVGDALFEGLTKQKPLPKKTICGRKLLSGKDKGKKCQKSIHPRTYGMCEYHWKRWKQQNPNLKSPGRY